ncbi:MAG TPA: VOC family protein [Acidimicrobiia bacterium]|nr:VOC family protein [Acidimicrobiia bacterium]
MTGSIRSINAVTLATADMAASLAFYDGLGFVRIVGDAASPFATYPVGDGFLNLQLDPEHAPVGAIWGRVIFFVDDVDAMHARVVAAGYRPEMEPSDAPWGERYFHVRDPDGHELSFAAPLGGS